MSKKKKSSSASGLYAMCITAGIILGLGLTPVMGNMIVMLVIGALSGTAVAFFINKNTPKPKRKHHH
jgi:hypothetical protein